MKTSSVRQQLSGSALAVVMISTAVLVSVTGSALLFSLNRRHTVNESAVWEEALVAAEAGVHQGVAQLNQGLNQNSLPTNTNTAGQTFSVTLSHTGEDSASASVTYKITRNDVTVANMVRPYYSIISTGTVNLPGGRSISENARDIILRKLNLANSGTVRTATRTIEAWAKPVYTTDAALKTDQAITLNNHNIYVDSFNSNDSNRSLTGGQPGTTMGQFNVDPYNIMLANVATNSAFIAGGNATIYGDAMTNGGVVGGSSGVQGEIRDDYFEPMAPVYPPDWASSVTPGVSVATGNGNSSKITTTVRSAVTLTGGTQASPAYYIVDSVALSGSSDVLTFAPAKNAASGSTSYTELYVRGNFTTKGGGATSADSGSIVIQPGVNVKLYILGSGTFAGNGIANQSGLAANFSLYGVNAPTPTADQTFTIAGNATFYGTVYAPGADLKLAGGGTSTSLFVGSLAGKSAYLNGVTQITYDEALMTGGLISRFQLSSWYEDTKKSGTFSGTIPGATQ